MLSEPSVGGIVINSRDITERKAFERRLEYQALHDSLTGLPNRTLFMDRLRHTLAGRSRREGKVAVLFLDLDNFKIINDSLGHGAGDQLLITVSERLRKCLRPTDTVARFGGDEFVFLLEDVTGVDDAVFFAERISNELLQAPLILSGQEVFAPASIGIALSSPDRELPDDLLRDADAAMYRAKKERVHYRVFDSSMDAHAENRLRIENDLRRVVARDKLRVFYQPKIEFATGRIVAMEALIRWEHPERGLVLPQEFIPLAEETGLIVPIGQWMLEQSCIQVKKWREQLSGTSSPMMCVNLSGRQLQHPKIVADVARVLRESELEPSSLSLEITESALMEDAILTKPSCNSSRSWG